MSRRVGIMGGTFDPVHHGHLVAAEETRYAFALDEVIFVPAGHPWQKSDAEVTAGDVRLEMCMLATATNDAFSVSRVELEREGPTYTIDTLRTLHDQLPAGSELFFITGADAILEILTWKDPDEAMRLATFVAVSRPGYDISKLDGIDPSVRTRVVALEIPALAISSTDIRRRVAEGRPIRYLVPDAVLSYIDERGLYRAV